MANTYTYVINTLDHQTADGKVLCVHYSVVGDNGDGVTATINGTTGLGGEVTIPYEELTEEIVIGWVKANLAIDQGIDTTVETEEEVTDEEGVVTTQVTTTTRTAAECQAIAEANIEATLDSQISAQVAPVRTYGTPW